MKPDSIEVKVQEIRDNIAIVRDSAGKTIEIPDRYYEEGETLVLSQAQLKAIEEGLDPYDTDAAVTASARGKGILAVVLILLALAAVLAGIYFLRLNGNSRQTSRGSSEAESNQETAISPDSANATSSAEDDLRSEDDEITEDVVASNQDPEAGSEEEIADTTLEEEIVSQEEEVSEADSKEDDEEARAAEEERERREREELEQRAAAEREQRAQAEREEQARLAAEAAAAEAEARAAADAYYNEIAAQIAGQSGHDAAGTLAGLSQSDALEVIRRLPTEKVAEIQEASAKAAEKAAQEAAEAAAQDAEALAQQ